MDEDETGLNISYESLEDENRTYKNGDITVGECDDDKKEANKNTYHDDMLLKEKDNYVDGQYEGTLDNIFRIYRWHWKCLAGTRTRTDEDAINPENGTLNDDVKNKQTETTHNYEGEQYEGK